MRHYMYQLTNKVNGRIYIGVHSCEGEFLDGKYFGSGVAIGRAVEKYGESAFSREVLQECSTREEVMMAEAEIVTTDFIEDRNNYNLITGGQGQVPSSKTKKKMSESASSRPPISEETRSKISENTKRMAGSADWRARQKERMSGENNPFFGKTHSKETIATIAYKNRGKVVGEDTKVKLSEAQRKRVSEGRGFIGHTTESRRKISEAQKGVKLVERTCPHCELTGRGGNMKRYHFDNCKYKEVING